MIKYEVVLKSTDIPVPISAEKFQCETGNVVFYSRPGKGEAFEEVARFLSSNVKAIKE